MQGTIVVNPTNDELYHFGVKGMKWGVRKAEYRDLDKAGRKNQKEKFKMDMQDAKKDWKSTRYAYTSQQGAGKSLAKFILLGPFGAYNYNSLRAVGNTRSSAAAKTIVANILGGPIGNAIASSMVSSAYKNSKIYGDDVASNTMSYKFAGEMQNNSRDSRQR